MSETASNDVSRATAPERLSVNFHVPATCPACGAGPKMFDVDRDGWETVVYHCAASVRFYPEGSVGEPSDRLEIRTGCNGLLKPHLAEWQRRRLPASLPVQQLGNGESDEASGPNDTTP